MKGSYFQAVDLDSQKLEILYCRRIQNVVINFSSFLYLNLNFFHKHLVPLTYVNEENGYCNARACTCQTTGTCNACNTFQFLNFHVLKIKIKFVHMGMRNSLRSWLIWGENNFKYKRFRIICTHPLQSVFKFWRAARHRFLKVRNEMEAFSKFTIIISLTFRLAFSRCNVSFTHFTRQFQRSLPFVFSSALIFFFFFHLHNQSI